MAKKWHEYVTTRNAVIGGGCAIVAAVIAGGLGLCGGDDAEVSVSTERGGSAVVHRDINVQAHDEGTAIVHTGEGHVTIGISEVAYRERLEEIKDLRGQLEEAMEAKKRTCQLVGGMKATRAWADSLASVVHH